MQSKGAKLQHLGYLATKKVSRWDKGLAARLPEAYKKFWKEWKHQEPTPVHWIPEQGKFKRNPETGEVAPVQNVALPVLYPKEHDEGIWGGEGIVKGFQKRHLLRRRVPHFWVPVLHKNVVYSEILDKHISLIVTERTIRLIHQNYGFDYYLLKTPACDLKSDVALKLKRKLLMTLHKKEMYPGNPKKQEEIYDKYKQYLLPEEEIEWYGLSFKEACIKFHNIEKEKIKIEPLKHKYRKELLERLNEADEDELDDLEKSSSWLSRFNPFGSKKEATENA